MKSTLGWSCALWAVLYLGGAVAVAATFDTDTEGWNYSRFQEAIGRPYANPWGYDPPTYAGYAWAQAQPPTYTHPEWKNPPPGGPYADPNDPEWDEKYRYLMGQCGGVEYNAAGGNPGGYIGETSGDPDQALWWNPGAGPIPAGTDDPYRRFYRVGSPEGATFGSLVGGKTLSCDLKIAGFAPGDLVSLSGRPLYGYWYLSDDGGTSGTPTTYISKLASSFQVNNLTSSWATKTVDLEEANFQVFSDGVDDPATPLTFAQMLVQYEYYGFMLLSDQVTTDPNDAWNQTSTVGGDQASWIERFTHYGGYAANGPMSTTLCIDNFTANTTPDFDADLIYDPVTGNVKLDSANAAGGVLSAFKLESAAQFIPPHNMVIAASPSFYTSTDSLMQETANPFSPPSGVFDLGDVFPTGLDLAGLTAMLTTAQYNGALGTPITPFELFVQASRIPGDADEDGDVDINDLSALASNWGETSGMGWDDGDFDGDGDVDINDLSALASNWGYGTEGGMSLGDALGSAGIPEPATLALLGLGAMALLRRRRAA